MARDFDGTDDNIGFGSDASIDDFSLQAIAFHINIDVAGVTYDPITKDALNNGWAVQRNSANRLIFAHSWSSGATLGRWQSNATTYTTGTYHIAIVYDGTSTANDPIIYVDGVVIAITETHAPAGTLVADAPQNMIMGENGLGSGDFNGQIQDFCYDNQLWSAEDVNRHRWYGVSPGGPSTVQVWHPMWTDSLVNKGTATANGTATGSTMGVSIPRTERMLAAMMGVGR